MTDIHFMKLALNEAKNSEFPFGCVLIKDGEVIATWKSGWENSKFDPTLHSEINAIKIACNKLKTRNLKWVKLYTTCEPCPMCFTAAWRANISEIIYWVSLKKSSELFVQEIMVDSCYLNKKWWNKIKIKSWVLEKEILDFMNFYFYKNWF